VGVKTCLGCGAMTMGFSEWFYQSNEDETDKLVSKVDEGFFSLSGRVEEWLRQSYEAGYLAGKGEPTMENNNNAGTGKMELIEIIEHEDGGATYSFDVDDNAEKLTKELGLKLILYCGLCEVNLDDAFQLILDRGKYLEQEPYYLDGDIFSE